MVVEPAEIVAYIVFFIICQFVTLGDYVILEMVESGTGYAWVYCEHDEDMDCSEVMLSANITGRAGIFFGSSNRYMRLTLIRRQTNFENLAAHLSVLVSQG
jgi:hypothetical protein